MYMISDALEPIESTVTCPTDDQTLPLTVACVVIFVYNLFFTVFGCYLGVSIHICNQSTRAVLCSNINKRIWIYTKSRFNSFMC